MNELKFNTQQPNAAQMYLQITDKIREASLALSLALEAAAILERGGNLPEGFTAKIENHSFDVLSISGDAYFYQQTFAHRKALARRIDQQRRSQIRAA